MKRVVVDTNVFLRFLLDDIPVQRQEAEMLFSKAKKGTVEVFVPQIVVFELEFVLRKYYQLPKPEVILKIKSLINTPYFQISDRQTFIMALNIFDNSTFSFVDAFLMTTAQNSEGQLFSFDKKINKL